AGPVLAGLTNVAVYREPAPGSVGEAPPPDLGDQYRLGRYRVDAWRTVLERIEAAGDTAALARTALRFSGVSAQAANLALNTVEELRTDWVNLLLGGENSRWSNFELAEASARLVTGRAVRGALADRVLLPGDDPADGPDAAPAPLGEGVLRDGVRRRVLHAMELVARPGGTAGRLSPAVEGLRSRLRSVDGAVRWELYAFAKTGTPAVEVFAGGERLDRQGGVLTLTLLAVPADIGRRAAASVDAWVSACSLDPGLRRGILEVPPVEALDPERAVALSMAVYLDDLDPGEGSGSAVDLALEVVDDLGDHLVREVRRRVEDGGG
ncbi:MAG TPA: hypothetical protein VLL48_11280, partial [Longimicrobiales bacterium]|nr:hypothetical protein [Longimicrobiales bacterium]